MRLFHTIVAVILCLSCWGFSDGDEISTNLPPQENDYFDEISTTLNPSSSDCTTSTGDAGTCSSFEECYPLALASMSSIQDEFGESGESSPQQRAILSLTPLEEELLETSRSIQCPTINNETRRICCKLDNFSELEEQVFNDDDNTANTENPGAVNLTLSASTSSASPFPKDCGRSSLLSWRTGGGGISGGISAKWVAKGQKITGGRTAPQFQYPWMIAIFGKNGKITCGATLLTRDFILTAAHCIASYNSKDLTQLKIHVGDYNIMSLKDGPHELRRVSQAFVHKGFNSKTYHNDIALIRMDKPVTFSERIQPICLPRADTNMKQVEGKAVIVAGWGRDRQWGYDSATLRLVEMPVWKLEDCRRLYNTFAPNRLNESMNLCAGDGKRNKDACIGDSGGPLMAEQGNYAFSTNSPIVQLGIVSWGKGCGSFPGVYTNVANYIPWIEKHVRNNSG